MGWDVETIQPRGSTLIYWAAFNGTGAQITNIPATFTEYLAGNTNKRVQVDLSGRTRCRMMLNCGATPGPTGSTMECQYSLDAGNTWSSSFITTTMVATDASHAISAWVQIPVAARTDVLLRMGSNGGDTTTDPTPNILYLEVQ